MKAFDAPHGSRVSSPPRVCAGVPARLRRLSVLFPVLLLFAATPVLATGFAVSVHDVGNPPLELAVEATNLIHDLKQQIHGARGYPVATQVLVHDGSRLADSSTVAENNIDPNDLLYLTVDLGPLPGITVSSISSGTLELVVADLTAGITYLVQQTFFLRSPSVWMNVAEGPATSHGTNWTLSLPPAAPSAAYRILELDPRPLVVEYPGYELIWQDEFEGPGIDPTKWGHQIGDGTLYGQPAGWGNNEVQLYTDTPENSLIVGDEEGNSVLLIQAVRGAGPDDYTSARMVTDGLHAFRYGRIEARIRLPYSQGAWPAFWLLGTNQPVVNWPGCGEIDVLEMVGGAEDSVRGNLLYVDGDHRLAEAPGSSTMAPGRFSDGYHLYRIDWTPDDVTWSVDGVAYHTTPVSADMKEFHRGFYLLLNIAVGGTWPGDPSVSSVFPMRMFVDYVRVYRDLSLVDPGEPPLDIDEETLGAFLFDATEAIQNGFTPFQNVDTIVWGPAAPDLALSPNAVDGAWGVRASYPGTSWGGMYWELGSPRDMSAYAGGSLAVALKVPANVTGLELKLESSGGDGSRNLLEYTPVPINTDFAEYTIPLADFTALGVDLSTLTIPFALWNPQGTGGWAAAEILVDNIRFVAPSRDPLHEGTRHAYPHAAVPSGSGAGLP